MSNSLLILRKAITQKISTLYKTGFDEFFSNKFSFEFNTCNTTIMYSPKCKLHNKLQVLF